MRGECGEPRGPVPISATALAAMPQAPYNLPPGALLCDAVAARPVSLSDRDTKEDDDMAQIERWAEITWQGNLQGNGEITHTSSGALHDLPYTFASRVESPDGKTSPEELLAAAHGACYTMFLSGVLAKAGTPPEQLSVKATCTLSRGDAGLTVESMLLDVTGRADGLTEAGLQAAAEQAKAGCPISRAIANNVRVALNVHLG
jgi:osmotically inducible protein OsmC